MIIIAHLKLSWKNSLEYNFCRNFITERDTVVLTISVERNRTDMVIYQLNTDMVVASALGTVVHVFQMTVVYAMVIIMVAQQHILAAL